MMVGGAGVGLVIPTLTAAGASSLPPERFATGAAVLTMGRQIGSALGIALLVAVLGSHAARTGDFQPAWLITIAGSLAAGAALAALGPPERRTEDRPAGAEAPLADPVGNPLIAGPLIADSVIAEPLVAEEAA
jgi:MFS family permease